MQDGQKTVWSIPYVSVAFFPSLKQNFIAYRSSKVSSRPGCIFEIHQLWQSGFSRVYSNCCCSCSFEAKIIKIGQSSHKMYSNNILNFQESMTILNACTKRSGNLLNAPCIISIILIQILCKFYGYSLIIYVLMKMQLKKKLKGEKCVSKVGCFQTFYNNRWKILCLSVYCRRLWLGKKHVTQKWLIFQKMLVVILQYFQVVLERNNVFIYIYIYIF